MSFPLIRACTVNKFNPWTARWLVHRYGNCRRGNAPIISQAKQSVATADFIQFKFKLAERFNFVFYRFKTIFTAPQKVSLIAHHKIKINSSSESGPHCAPQNENLLLLRKWASLRVTKLKNTAPQKMDLIALHKIKIYCSSESEPHCASQNKN